VFREVRDGMPISSHRADLPSQEINIVWGKVRLHPINSTRESKLSLSLKILKSPNASLETANTACHINHIKVFKAYSVMTYEN